jgi:predicted membrane protein
MLSRQGNLFRRQTGFEQKEDFRMKFLDKLRVGIAHFMSGRYGTDQLGFTMVITALIVTFIGAITGARTVCTVIADVLLVLCFVRMLSKDRPKRARENQIFLQKTAGVRRGISEWWNRMKNMRKYHYYTCPKCHKKLRVPRGVGHITITCRGCGEKFDRKA